MTATTVKSTKVLSEILEDDGTFPNNPELPLLIYRGVIRFNQGDPAFTVEQICHSNNWKNSWRNGIYSFHHYHSTAHEVLGIYSGSVRVQLGGSGGITEKVGTGDVIVIPAGVSHKNIGSSNDFRCVGAYANGQIWDMNYGKDGERPQADENIAKVQAPTADPIFGKEGPLMDQWNFSA